MTTPKEKAEQLLNRFWFDTTLDELEQAKDCALIAVDEILKVVNIWSSLNMQKSSQVIFWEEVKEELEKL